MSKKMEIWDFFLEVFYESWAKYLKYQVLDMQSFKKYFKYQELKIQVLEILFSTSSI